MMRDPEWIAYYYGQICRQYFIPYAKNPYMDKVYSRAWSVGWLTTDWRVFLSQKKSEALMKYFTLIFVLLCSYAHASTRVTMFGDSIGAGYWADGLHGVLDMATDPFTKAEVHNLAINGQQLIEMHNNFNPSLLGGSSRNVVLVEGGTNDIHATSASVAFSRLQLLLGDILGADPAATVILSTVTPRVTPGDRVKINEYNNLVHSIVTCVLWDAAATPGMGDPFRWDLYKDGLHPTTLGHQILAAPLKPLLRSVMPDMVDDSFNPADFNLDGLVTPSDLDAAKTYFVDGENMLTWQREVSMAPAFTAIPEPSALVLCLAFMVFTQRKIR